MAICVSDFSTKPDFDAITKLAKQYSPLNYITKSIELLGQVFPGEDFGCYSKYQLHELLNQLLLANYTGEQTLKYLLIEKYLDLPDVIGGLEMNAGNSRADFLAISGHTTCFEIKSKLDNLSKLPKQVNDYLQTFDYNVLIVDECHASKAEQIIPKEFGFWTSTGSTLVQRREATFNHYTDPGTQLKLLTKKELGTGFPKSGGCRDMALSNWSRTEINNIFRETLKRRYSTRWQFLQQHRGTILPMDMQFFFQVNVLPVSIYA